MTTATNEDIRGWFAGRIPEGWFTGPPEVSVDRDEILVVGTLPDIDLAKDATPDEVAAARAGRISGHREDTRGKRMQIADEAQRKFQKKVSWGIECGDVRKLFTHLGVPVMTRLRIPERQVLDTLVDAGVARSRSHALAWCVRLVQKNQSEWIDQLREALVEVEKVRDEGPTTS
jgi:hypothetical protein